MKIFSPAVRLGLGLMLLTLSFLLVADMLGLVPNPNIAEINARRTISEVIALQLSGILTKQDQGLAKTMLKAIPSRYEKMLSIAVRDADGHIIIDSGQHSKLWQDSGIAESTPTHIKVPLLRGNKLWGTLELLFQPLRAEGIRGFFYLPILHLLLFMGITTLYGFYFFLRKALQYLDPSAVIPARVKAAMDTMTEGVLILDEKEQIVLANNAFSKLIGIESLHLMGQKPSQFPWYKDQTRINKEELAWMLAITQHQSQIGQELRLESAQGMRLINVNSAPIFDGKGHVRGAMITFDDVTVLQEKNEKLNQMLTMLEKSQKEISLQNTQLEKLATLDPLTGCFNRRSFMARFEQVFHEAKEHQLALCCLMIDIDHFKNVNDTYGHAAGDQVIQNVANILLMNCRAGDMICRYGGEEFCFYLQDCSLMIATQRAEKIRTEIANQTSVTNDQRNIVITSSFGLTAIEFGAKNISELIEQADQALYRAKRQGRNQCVIWQATGCGANPSTKNNE